MTTDTITNDFDGFWKDALDFYVRELTEFVAPDVDAAVDWSAGIEMLDKELPPASPFAESGRRFVDKLARVQLKSGDKALLLIHVEVQHERDAAFEARMYTYWSRVREHFGEPVFSIAILGDDEPHWRPSMHEEVVFGTRLRFEFVSLKLLDFDPRLKALEESGNPFAMLIAIDRQTRRTRPDSDRLNTKSRMLRAIARDERFTPDDVVRLYQSLTRLLRLPEDLDLLFDEHVRTLEDSRVVYVTPMELRAIERGRAGEARTKIMRVLASRFGETSVLDATVRDSLARITRMEVLDPLFDVALTAKSREEFLASLAKATES